MNTYLCRSRACNLPGQHLVDADPDDCGPDCRGCAQAAAADGLQLCRVCERRIGHDAWRAAWLYRALGEALTGGQGTGGATGAAAREPGLSLREPAVEAREAIRVVLIDLVRLIATERGIAPPAGYAQAIGAYVGRHATWLAAHPRAGRHAEQLRDIALDPRTMALAFPGGRGGRQLIGTCPLPISGAGEACGTPLYAVHGQAVIACRGCHHEGILDDWYRLLVGEDPPPISAAEAARRLSALWGQPVSADSVRKWGQRWHRTSVRPIGRWSLTRGGGYVVQIDDLGRARYRWDDVATYATRLWGVPAERVAEDDGA